MEKVNPLANINPYKNPLIAYAQTTRYTAEDLSDTLYLLKGDMEWLKREVNYATQFGESSVKGYVSRKIVAGFILINKTNARLR